MRSKFIAWMLFTTLAASAQTVVTSITPASGPDIGGTEVRITGDHLSPAVACILPCPPRVTFGDITVDAQSESDHALLATTPPHAAGTVDVAVAVPGYTTAVVANGFTFTTTTQSTYEQILLPVYIDGIVHGANGTQWKTDFWMRNNGDAAAMVAPWTCPPDLSCPPVFPLTTTLGVNSAMHNPSGLFTGSRTNPSQLIYLFKTPAPHVSASLRVADVSRHDLNAGTDIPVIRESDLLTAPAQILNVPLDAATSRVLLRIYDVTFTSAPFVVTISPQSETPVAAIRDLSVTATTSQSGAFRNEAAYAQVDLTGLLPAAGTVRVEVRPLTPGSRYWAFASITNNQTQLVTLARP